MTSNSENVDIMLTAGSSVRKEGRCPLPVIDLVLDVIGSSYVVPAALSYISSNGGKHKGKR